MRIYFVLFAVLISVPKEDAVINSPPVNKATQVHQQTYLNCSSSSSSYPAWQFGIPGGSSITIVTGSCVVVVGYTTKYRSESTGTGSCNLIILSPTFDEAGIYTCIDPSDFTQAYATVTVLNATGTPTINNSSDVVEGDVLTFTCTVLYNTSTATTVSFPIPPILFWTDPNGINITAVTIINAPNLVTSFLFGIIATKQDILSYKCTAYFNPPSSSLPPTVASNAPSDTFFWETYQINDILFPVDGIYIAAGECSEGFATFTCQASSNPPPSYQWIDFCLGVISINSTIQLQQQGFYTCIASNVIRGTTHQLLENITFSGCPQLSTISWASPSATTSLLTIVTEDDGDLHASTESSSNSSTTESSCCSCNNNNDTTTIILSVFLGISLILNIAAVAAFTYRRHLSTSSSSSSSEGKPRGKSIDREPAQIYQELNQTNSSGNGLAPVTYEKLILPDNYQELNPITCSKTEPLTYEELNPNNFANLSQGSYANTWNNN